jgi:dienelactone hydrolase
MSGAQGRKLLLKLWYPAQVAPGAIPERFWEQLQDPHRAPLLVRSTLRWILPRSASYPNAPLASGMPMSSTVIYNHGLVSFASENTSLMQELASRGHVVIAIEHEEQLEEFRALNRAQSREDKERARALTAQLRRATPGKQALLARQLYETSVNTGRIVAERAEDTRFVLGHLGSVLEAIPGRTARCGNTLPVHLVGYSVGGAIATRVGTDAELGGSVTNIDGGLYGTPDAVSVRLPYLMLYSAGVEGINDALLPTHATRLTAPKTTHLNFHDVAGMLPLLRWARVLGRARAAAALDWRNRAVVDFIEGAGAVPRA